MNLRKIITMSAIALASFGVMQSVNAQTGKKKPVTETKKTFNGGGIGTPAGTTVKVDSTKKVDSTTKKAAVQKGGTAAKQDTTKAGPPSYRTQMIASFKEAYPTAYPKGRKLPATATEEEKFKNLLPKGDLVGDDKMWAEPFLVYEIKGGKGETDKVAVFSQFKHASIPTFAKDSAQGGIFLRIIEKAQDEKEYDATKHTTSIGFSLYNEHLFNGGPSTYSMVFDFKNKSVTAQSEGYVYFTGNRELKGVDTATGNLQFGEVTGGRRFSVDTTYQLETKNEVGRLYKKAMNELDEKFKPETVKENLKRYNENPLDASLMESSIAITDNKKYVLDWPRVEPGPKVPAYYNPAKIKQYRKLFHQ